MLNNAGWGALEDGDFNQAITLFIRAVAERNEGLDDFHSDEFGRELSEDEGTKSKGQASQLRGR